MDDLTDRFPPADKAVLPAGQWPAYERIERRRGRIPAPFVPLLASPDVAEAFDGLSEILQHGSLPAVVREAVFLRTARSHRCAYLWMNHLGKAAQAGLDAKAQAALASGEIPSAPTTVVAVARFVAELRDEHRVTQPVYDDVVLALGVCGVVELTAFCGFATSIAMLLNMRQPALPPGPPAPF